MTKRQMPHRPDPWYEYEYVAKPFEQDWIIIKLHETRALSRYQLGSITKFVDPIKGIHYSARAFELLKEDDGTVQVMLEKLY